MKVSPPNYEKISSLINKNENHQYLLPTSANTGTLQVALAINHPCHELITIALPDDVQDVIFSDLSPIYLQPISNQCVVTLFSDKFQFHDA